MNNILFGFKLKFIITLSINSLLLCLFLSPAQAAGTPSSGTETLGLFGSHETMSHQMKAFKKWNSMLERSKDDDTRTAEKNIPCHHAEKKKCDGEAWRYFLTFLKDKSAENQMTEINVYINKAPYITDIINWGVPDYWATLRQFLRKDGDCEDYAIAKYISLKELGFDANLMRIVVVQDTNLDVPHAILVVSLNGQRWVLDNQISYIVKEKAILHYKPLYSINENAWWLHRM